MRLNLYRFAVATEAEINIHLKSYFRVLKFGCISYVNAGYYVYMEGSNRVNGQRAYLTSVASYPNDNVDR